MTSANGFEGIRNAKVNGTTLAYREQGDGEPVVFVHGGISDLRVWDAQLPEIGRSYRAISYSRRYAQPNEPIDPAAADPIAQQVEDLAAFIREIDAKPAHIVGNSWGALISLLTAIRHPDVVRSLVLEEPPALTLFTRGIPPPPIDLVRLFFARPRTAVAGLRFVLGTVADVQRAYAKGEDEEALWTFLRGVMGRKPIEQLPELLRAQMLENAADLKATINNPSEVPAIEAKAVRGIHAPVLLVTGELSPDFLLRLTDRLEELLPNAERVEIRGASHVMHVEDPAATNRAILAFLGRGGASVS